MKRTARVLVMLAALVLPLAAWTAPAQAQPQNTILACDYPNWVAGQWYNAGAIVRYTNGLYYIAEHGNPGYDPTISTWYWDPYNCNGTPSPSGFPVSQAQFNQMFPNRNSFYTYSGLINATSAYSAFAKTGDDTTRKREAAAFLANVKHETGGLVHIVEQNTANYPHYCDWSQPYGCPAGQSAYYGRGPIQLSWNFNYKAAGDALGLPLLTNPWLVQNDAAVSWKTAIWYWMTQSGPGPMTAHNAMVGGHGFGYTIRASTGRSSATVAHRPRSRAGSRRTGNSPRHWASRPAATSTADPTRRPDRTARPRTGRLVRMVTPCRKRSDDHPASRMSGNDVNSYGFTDVEPVASADR